MFKWYAITAMLIMFWVGLIIDKKKIVKKFNFSIAVGLKELWSEFVWSAACGLVISAIVFFFVSSYHMKRAEKDYEVAWRCSIVSLNDNNSVYINRSYSSSKSIYNYAVQEKMGKTPYKVESSGGDVSIDDVLDSPQGAEIICYKYDYKDKKITDKYWDVGSEYRQIRYVFRVPKGTFQEKFEVDMK